MVKIELKKKSTKEISNNIDVRFCANCLHCKMRVIRFGDNFKQRVACKKLQWTTATGVEKMHKFHTVYVRKQNGCNFYASMGEVKGYIVALAKDLPSSDMIYNKTENGLIQI